MEMEIINQICTVCLIPIDEHGKDESLSKQLSIVYLVHTLLEVPLDECTQYLEKYGNPNNWVTLCTSCSCVVQEAKEINRKILELEDELECLKKKILLPMKVKVNEEDTLDYQTHETAAYMIRKFVYANKHNEAIDDYLVSSSTTFKNIKKSRVFSRRKRIKDTSERSGMETKDCKPAVHEEVHASTIKLTGIELEESLKEGETWKCPICDKKYTKKRTWRDHIRRKHHPFLLHLEDKITDDHVCLVGQCVPDSSTFDFSSNDTNIIQIGKSDSDLEQDLQNKKINNTINKPRRWASLRFRQKYPGPSGTQSNAVKESLSDSENDSVQNYSDYTPTFSDRQSDSDEEYVLPQNDVKRSIRNDKSVQESSCENDNYSASPFGMNEPIAKKFSCNFCEKAYSHDRSLRQHVRVAHGTEHKKNFGQENDVEKLQSKEKNISCHICSSKFGKQDGLVAHMRVKHGIRKIRRGAVRENKDWETIIKQREEKLKILMNSEQYKNKETKKRKNERSKLNLYVLAKRNNIKEFPCKDCSNTFTTFKDWQVHINKTHKTGFRCHLCKLVVASQLNLENHIRAVHHPASILICSGCNKTFQKSDVFNEHLKSNPDCKAKAFPCTMCKYLFGTKDCLDIHNEIRHISQPPAPYACSKCPKTFETKRGLEFHVQVHHSKINKVVCDKCGSEFRNVRSLQDHQRSVHGTRKYPCPVCKKVFKNSSGLSRHKKLHQEEFPHLCNICGKGFKVANYLTIHMWSHDPDRKEKYSSYKPKTKNKAPKKRFIKNCRNSDNDSMETFYENTELNQSDTPKQSSEQELNVQSSQQQHSSLLSEINNTRLSSTYEINLQGQTMLSEIPVWNMY